MKFLRNVRKSDELILLDIPAIAFIVFFLDQFSKYWADLVWRQDPWGPFSWFFLTYSENDGIAFGIPFGEQALIVVSALLIVAFVWYIFKFIDLKPVLNRVMVAIVLGGALGNFVDRFMYGFVRDFIQIGLWPTFNIADMGIVIGLVVLLFRIPQKSK
jgi:signal peptidase II